MDIEYNLLLRNARLGTEDLLQDIWIQKDSFVRITPAEELKFKPARSINARGQFCSRSFFKIQIHLDIACILDRCTIE